MLTPKKSAQIYSRANQISNDVSARTGKEDRGFCGPLDFSKKGDEIFRSGPEGTWSGGELAGWHATTPSNPTETCPWVLCSGSKVLGGVSLAAIHASWNNFPLPTA